ncbi:MAG: AAA family ATPase [Roseivirga sp.]
MKYLPIGLQSIREILEGGYVYVDKTGFAKELIENKQRRHCFFSRPRRFGKSLFLNTLEEIFKGNKALFQGYQIDGGDYDWPVHPVLSFNFAQIANETREAFESDLKESLEELAELSGVTSGGTSCQAKLRRLVTLLSKKGPVVVLVDEYDKLIIDNLHNPETAEANCQLLQSFFGVLKNLGQHVRFTFVTGITKFSQVSLFSGPNHLNDITMFPQYAGMMGYTEGELVQYFDKHIQAIAEERTQQGQQVTEEAVLSEIKQWNSMVKTSFSSFFCTIFTTLFLWTCAKHTPHCLSCVSLKPTAQQSTTIVLTLFLSLYATIFQ